jgi:ethanolamine utilization protein EutN
MQSALVLGNAISTVKHRSLGNLKLLVCQPFGADGCTRDGGPLLAVDQLGAGAGDWVLLTSDGGVVRERFGVENSPIRWTVLGLLDGGGHSTARNIPLAPPPNISTDSSTDSAAVSRRDGRSGKRRDSASDSGHDRKAKP